MTQITLPDADLAAALDGVSTDHFFTQSSLLNQHPNHSFNPTAKTSKPLTQPHDI